MYNDMWMKRDFLILLKHAEITGLIICKIGMNIAYEI